MPPSIRNISLRHLRMVSVIGRELNISRSAELLHTSQPALSRALAQLESDIGAQLFLRTTTRVALTPAGATLMQHANRVLAELELAQEDLAGLHKGVRGEVRIGMISVFSSELLAKAIGRARDVLPQVAFSVELMRVQELYEALVSGRIDLMLSHPEIELNLTTVDVTELYTEHTEILVSLDHPLTKRKKITEKDLANCHWVLPASETPLRRKLNRFLSLHRPASTKITDVQTDSLYLSNSLVRNSGMLWGVASHVAKQSCSAGGVCILQTGMDTLVSGPMCAMVFREKMIDTSTRILMNSLRDCAVR